MWEWFYILSVNCEVAPGAVQDAEESAGAVYVMTILFDSLRGDE